MLNSIKRLPSGEVSRFIFVGLINTIFGYFVYFLFIWLGMSYFISLVMATISGIAFNFHTIGKFVFKNQNKALIFKFFFVYSFIFLLNLAAIKIFIRLGFSDYTAGAMAIFPSAIISFLLNKFFVFKR